MQTHLLLLLTGVLSFSEARAQSEQPPSPDKVFELSAEESDIVITAPQLVGLPAKFLRAQLPSGTLKDRVILQDRSTMFLVDYDSINQNTRFVAALEPPEAGVEGARLGVADDARVEWGGGWRERNKIDLLSLA